MEWYETPVEKILREMRRRTYVYGLDDGYYNY